MREKRTGIYIRVSTDAQAEEGYSIEAQTEQLEAYCKAKKWENTELYVDGGWSGSNIERPEMKRMLEDAENDRLERCLVYKLDRLSRSQKDVLYIIEDVFIPHGVDFVSVTESLDTGTPMGRAMIGILAAFAQLERENIKMRTRMGMKERVKAGYWMGGGRVPFGYDYDSKQGILVPNEDAEKVRLMYRLYLDGESPQAIADRLGLKYDRLVMNILQRKSNIGIIEYNGEEYRGRHEPIIDRETFNKTAEEISLRSVKRTNHTDYLLSGLLYCGKCGAKMRYQKWGGRGSKIVCYSQQKSKRYLVKDENCPQKKIWADEVERIVIDALFGMKPDPEASAKAAGAKESGPESLSGEIISVLEKRAEELSRRIRRLYKLYAENENELLLESINEYRAELESVHKDIEREKNENAIALKRKKLDDMLTEIKDCWEYMSFSERKAVIRAVINRIVINGDRIDIFTEH
ncbi:MAG: recombinase family protein [Bacillota bacterium]|nr:recombinase family protein [Bacillota bacterium]